MFFSYQVVYFLTINWSLSKIQRCNYHFLNDEKNWYNQVEEENQLEAEGDRERSRLEKELETMVQINSRLRQGIRTHFLKGLHHEIVRN